MPINYFELIDSHCSQIANNLFNTVELKVEFERAGNIQHSTYNIYKYP